MSTSNLFNLIGRLGADAAVRTNKAGGAFLALRIAVSRRVKGADGTWTNQSDWFDAIKSAKDPESAAKQTKVFAKGSLVAVSGELRTREVTLDGGAKIRVPSLYVMEAEVLTSATARKDAAAPRTAAPTAPAAAPARQEVPRATARQAAPQPNESEEDFDMF